MMNKDNLKNTLFGVGLAILLLLGLTVTFSPVGGGLRNRLLEMVNTPGNLFHYVAGLFRGEDEEETPVELPDDAQNADAQAEEQTLNQPQNPGETPVDTFEDNKLDTDYTPPAQPSDNEQPTHPEDGELGQDELPMDHFG